MKFYDREEELAMLKQGRDAVGLASRFTVLVGRRRVGKTALLLQQADKKDFLYLFVSRKSQSLLCAEFQQEAQKALGIQIFGVCTQFAQLFEQLLVFSASHPFTLVIDEFQDFSRVDKSIFSDIQRLWDMHASTARINLIACGSIYSMMIKVFEDEDEPLFGRADNKMVLRPFTVATIKEILQDHNKLSTNRDLLTLYAICGGIPRYLAIMMDGGATTQESMLDMVCRKDSQFLREGYEVLLSEFGRDHSIYFSILQLIAQGRNTQSAIDSIIEKNTGAYLENLEQEYSLIRKIRPFGAKPQSRSIHWQINDCFLRFWFRFVYSNVSLVEAGRLDLLREIIERDWSGFCGLVLEEYFRQKYREEGRFTEVGSYWSTKGTDEIDLVAVSELDKTALLAEVKMDENKYSFDELAYKARNLVSALKGYDVSYTGLSLSDM